MSTELKEKVNQISMLLVMTADDDEGGLGIIKELCKELSVLAAESPSHMRLKQAADHAQFIVSHPSPARMETLNQFASSAIEYLEGQTGLTFPHESSDTNSASVPAKIETVPQSTAREETSIGLGSYTISGEKEIMVEFAAEAEEHLGNVEEIILESAGSYTKESIDTIFRGVHSLKGGSAYFNLEEITKTSHLLESLLDEVRSDKRVFDEELKDLVLEYIDLEKRLIKEAKKASDSNGVLQRTEAANEFLEALKEYAKGESAQIKNKEIASKAVSKTRERQNNAKQADESPEKAGAKSFVKIETARLDLLIDSIGEMAIYSSMLVRLCREKLGSVESVLKTTSQVEKFARDLQDIGMSMRLVPIKGLFQKMSRLVWDTGKKLNKEISFEMAGEDTELDRNLIDKIADPLMHMVRNSVDHGIEPAEERVKKGKPAQGQVKLSAYHSGGNVHIAVEDDGRGLDPEKLLRKAVEKGIIKEGEQLKEQEIFQLIFAAGFSTAAVVTDVSGRGVGMDVVRRNVEALRGHIHIKSEVDRGSTFIIEIPLTLAMVDGIEIKVGTEHFIIPSLSIIEFIRPQNKMLSSTLDFGETFHFRGKYLPIFRVAELYDIEAVYSNPVDATLIVVENNQEYVALMVDEIVGEYSTVIKSLSPMFKEGQGISGCAIMPQGSVALILDIRHLIQLARSESSKARSGPEIQPESATLR